MAAFPGRENPFLLTRPELLSAKRKIAQVAHGFDPRKISFKGFECHSLDPTTFREQIRHNLLIHLTNAELGALVTLFDKDNDGRVNCAAFISEFLRLGSLERKKFLDQEKRCAEAIEKRKQKHLEERELAFEKLRKSNIKSTFTEEESKSAFDKFSLLAIGHDVYNSDALHGFVNGGKLSPVEFREQLRQSFHLYLSRGEVAALIHLFDDNGDGSIDCDEFIRSFYRIGYEEREKYYYKHLQRTRKLQQQEILRKKKRDEYYMQKNIISLPEDPAALLTEENRTTVFNKIKEIAVNYERRQHWGNLLMPFDSTSLSPTRFREVLKQQFLLHLTTSDLVVLLDEFGIDAVNGEREINCKEFLSYFFHAGREEKEKILRKKIMSDEKLSKVKLNFEKNLSRELLNRKITAIEWPVLPQISSDNVNSDDGKSVMSGSQSLSTLSIDDEKNDNMSLYSLHENDSDSISTHLSPLQPLNTFTSPSRRSSNRMYRKPSVLDTISPNRLALKLIKSEGSIAAAYPNASDETKKFLEEIEAKELAVRKMKKRRKKRNSVFRSPTSTSPSQSKSFQYEDDAEKSARQEENEYENDEYME